MKNSTFVPHSMRAARAHVRHALSRPLEKLPRKDFLRAWCSISYLYPGLHPDGYESEGSGWPRVLKRFAAEAWRRTQAGQFSDHELYCYQACKARLRRERAEIVRVAPWLLSDHFAA